MSLLDINQACQLGKLYARADHTEEALTERLKLAGASPEARQEALNTFHAIRRQINLAARTH